MLDGAARLKDLFAEIAELFPEHCKSVRVDGTITAERGELIGGLSFSLPRNGIVGVIGPNGVGKTTLFRMIVGEEAPDEGEVTVVSFLARDGQPLGDPNLERGRPHPQHLGVGDHRQLLGDLVLDYLAL